MRWPALAGTIGLVALLVAGCIAPGGYGYAPGYDYYEPYGGVYGGWAPGFEVGPFRDRGNDHRGDFGRGAVHGGASAPHHAFTAAPAGRATPSIPSRTRSGSGGGGKRH